MLSDLKGRIRRLFEKSRAGCILIINLPNADPNFFYLTRLQKSEFSHSILILDKNKIVLLVHRMEYELASGQAKKLGIVVRPFRTAKELEELILGNAKGKRIGLNFSKLPVSSFKSLKKILKMRKFIDVSKQLAEIRRTKTNEEIKLIEKTCGIASRVMREAKGLIKIGMKERELAAEIDKRMKIYGADEIAFPTIVATGKNSSNPHYTAGDGRIKSGDLVMVDFGCRVENYCSDITRTFVVGGPSAQQKEMLDTCKRMQDEVIQMLKPGVRFEDLQKKANSICEKRYGKMLHLIGHSLGVEVHDPIGDAKRLEEGMILTIEPALYLKGVGGVRIEDDVLITRAGHKALTE